MVAGVFEPEHGALVDFERSDWDLTMNLDLTSIFTMCKKVGGYTAAWAGEPGDSRSNLILTSACGTSVSQALV